MLGFPAGSFQTEGITSQSGDFMVFFSLNAMPPCTVSTETNPNKVNIKNITSSAWRVQNSPSLSVPAGRYAQYPILN
jgi:hypothetical protein